MHIATVLAAVLTACLVGVDASSHTLKRTSHHARRARTGLAPAARKLKGGTVINPTEGNGYLSNGYIVELEPSADISGALGKRSNGLTDHAALYSHLDKRSVHYKVRQEFNDDPSVFYGASLKLASAADAVHLATVPGVKSVTRIGKYWLVGQKGKHDGHCHKPGKPHKPSKPGHPSPPQTVPGVDFGPHVETGVGKLLAAGLDGKDVNIAFIDAGIDYTHPLLGGGFGPGHRVAKGHDFSGENADPNDPFANCINGAHGTAVAGIAAGSGDPAVGWSGVAPASTIFAYRIAGCNDTSVDGDVLMAAALRAAKDGADIINFSFASLGSWAADEFAVFIARLVDRTGILVTAAAGDDGNAGLFFGFTPGTAPNVFSVGSLNTISTTQFNLTTSTGYGPITYYGSHYFDFVNQPVVALSPFGTANDGCNALPTNLNLANKIVLIGRGGCPFYQKTLNAQTQGATRVLIYNQANQPFFPPGNSFDDTSEFGFMSGDLGIISNADGQYLYTQATTNNAFRLSGNDQRLVQRFLPGPSTIDLRSGGLGPTYDLYNSITFNAPGSDILTLWPVDLGVFHVIGGTSFSAPYTAGALALYIQKHRLSKPYDIASIQGVFASTARLTSGSYPFPGFDVVAGQGAGSLDAYAAVMGTTTKIEPSVFNLNATDYFAGSQVLRLTNNGRLPKVYTFSHSPAATIYTNDAGSIYPSNWPDDNDYSSSSASVRFSVKTRTIVWPGHTANVKLTFTPPSGLDASRIPIYSGFIQIKASGGEAFSVPYQGVAQVMKEVPILDGGAGVAGIKLPIIVDGDQNPQGPTATYTFQGTSVPQLVTRLVNGSPIWTVYVVPSDFALPPAPTDSRSFYPFSSIKTLGQFPGLSIDHISRNVNNAGVCNDDQCSDVPIFPWDGTVTQADGTSKTLPNGGYRFLITAQKITGDKANYYDYEIQLTDEVVIARS